MKEKKDETPEKLRGGYYTPQNIAKFLIDRTVDRPNLSIMEPSCGDGVFLQLLDEHQFKAGCILAIEHSTEEYEKCLTFKKPGYNVINSDFFRYFNSSDLKNKFDVVLGNPPYIRYQYFEKDQREEVIKIYKNLNLKFNKLTNIWVPFVVASVLSLNDTGKIGMVLPAELLQVKYAEQLRLFLTNNLNKITIFTFKELIFPNVEQEVILLLGEKFKSDKDGIINIIELNNANELENYTYNLNGTTYKSIDHTKEKWTRYFLSNEELRFLKKVSKKFEKLSHYCDIDVGIVTGANKYFVVNEYTLKTHRLRPIAIPLVGRTNHIPSFIFTKSDLEENIGKNRSSYLLDFSRVPNGEYNTEFYDYIRLGEVSGIHNRYKTSIRNEWYKIPSIWKSVGFFLRRIHTFPKIVVNDGGAYTTDTMHRIKIKDNYDIASLAFCFLNSVSFIYAELMGRSYGGGVLELPPNEAEEILIPYFRIDKKQLEDIDALYRETKDIEKVLDITDEIILKQKLGFTDSELEKVRKIWKKLRQRRLTRSRNGIRTDTLRQNKPAGQIQSSDKQCRKD